MTEQEQLDRLLRHALTEALRRDWEDTLANSPAEANQSPRQRRRMDAMLADPVGYARRLAYPLWQRALRTVACILLACTLTLGALMAVSPTVRAAVIQWVTEFYETQIVYYFRNEAPYEGPPQYTVGELPYGYEDTGESRQSPNSYTRFYENADGKQLRLKYGWIRQGSAVVINTDGMTVTEMKVNDCPGHLYLSQDPERSSAVVWMDGEKQVYFILDGYEPESVLLHIAESIILE